MRYLKRIEGIVWVGGTMSRGVTIEIEAHGIADDGQVFSSEDAAKMFDDLIVDMIDGETTEQLAIRIATEFRRALKASSRIVWLRGIEMIDGPDASVRLIFS